MIVTIPGLKLANTLNTRQHWRKRAESAKRQRHTVALVLRTHPRPTGPVVVTIVRVAPRALDSDNLAGACKSVRDGVADWLGVDDGVAERRGDVVWRVEARKGPVSVEIRVDPVLFGSQRCAMAEALAEARTAGVTLEELNAALGVWYGRKET